MSDIFRKIFQVLFYSLSVYCIILDFDRKDTKQNLQIEDVQKETEELDKVPYNDPLSKVHRELIEKAIPGLKKEFHEEFKSKVSEIISSLKSDFKSREKNLKENLQKELQENNVVLQNQVKEKITEQTKQLVDFIKSLNKENVILFNKDIDKVKENINNKLLSLFDELRELIDSGENSQKEINEELEKIAKEKLENIENNDKEKEIKGDDDLKEKMHNYNNSLFNKVKALVSKYSNEVLKELENSTKDSEEIKKALNNPKFSLLRKLQIIFKETINGIEKIVNKNTEEKISRIEDIVKNDVGEFFIIIKDKLKGVDSLLKKLGYAKA